MSDQLPGDSDVTRPSTARVENYVFGGTDNYAREIRQFLALGIGLPTAKYTDEIFDRLWDTFAERPLMLQHRIGNAADLGDFLRRVMQRLLTLPEEG